MQNSNYGPGDFMERTLTVINYTEAKGKEFKTRVTLSPTSIISVIGSEDPVQFQDGGKQHKVNVIFIDNNQMELYLTILDLTVLERAVGMYFAP